MPELVKDLESAGLLDPVLISDAAEAAELYSEDELEEYAEVLRNNQHAEEE